MNGISAYYAHRSIQIKSFAMTLVEDGAIPPLS
jgi:hypothetical protein